MTATETIGVDAPAKSEFSLLIGGMTCGACVARIERHLNALDGVAATVNLASERARVSTVSRVTIDRIIEEIEGAGFSAEVLKDETSSPDDGAEADRQVRYLGRRLVVAGLLFMPLGDASNCIFDRTFASLSPLAVASSRPFTSDLDVGSVAVLPERCAQRSPRHLDHGHVGVAWHHLRPGVVALLNVRAGLEFDCPILWLRTRPSVRGRHLSRCGGGRDYILACGSILRSVDQTAIWKCTALTFGGCCEGSVRSRRDGIRAKTPCGGAQGGGSICRATRRNHR